jgi:hypothetical protein
MKGKKGTKKRYSYPLKLDETLKEPLEAKAKKSRRTVNEEINVAVEIHVKKD